MRHLLAAICIVSFGVPVTVMSAPIADAAGHQVGAVRFIRHGLGVQPPGGRSVAGRVRMPLFNNYGLRTGASEEASVGFRDGTMLHINQRTDAVITSPSVTKVRQGEVDEDLAPGADHRIQTAAAVASAIGTNFLVRIIGRSSYVMVLHGAVLVANPQGTVVVKSNQGSLVIPGQAPEPAYPVDAGTATGWIGSLPNPHLPQNVALDSSGGFIAGFSSQYSAAGTNDYGPVPYGLAANLIDGRLDAGWESDTGHPSQQFVTVGFAGKKVKKVSAVFIDPAATQGDPAASDLRQFAIAVSSTGTAATDFHTVLTGECKQKNAMQRFKLPAHTSARYLQLLAQNNYGDPRRVAVAELEVVSP
jgi:hypothetical protein